MGMTEAIALVLVLVALVEAIKKNNRPLALSDYFNKSNTANRL